MTLQLPSYVVDCPLYVTRHWNGQRTAAMWVAFVSGSNPGRTGYGATLQFTDTEDGYIACCEYVANFLAGQPIDIFVGRTVVLSGDPTFHHEATDPPTPRRGALPQFDVPHCCYLIQLFDPVTGVMKLKRGKSKETNWRNRYAAPITFGYDVLELDLEWFDTADEAFAAEQAWHPVLDARFTRCALECYVV